MSYLQLAVDVLIGLAGVTVGYVQAMRTMNRKPPKHVHAYDQWELTDQVRKRYRSNIGWEKHPIQQRTCIGCGYVQREEVDF